MVIDISSDDNNDNEKSVSLAEIPTRSRKDKNSNNNSGNKLSSHNNNNNNKIFKHLLLDTKLVRFVNEQFENYILDVDSYNYESYLKQYFREEDKGRNYLLILRVNVFEEI